MKHNFVKRLTALFIVTALLTASLLSGCGKKGTNSTGSTGESSQPNAPGLHQKEEQTTLTDLKHFNLDEVTLTDKYCENALALEVKYLTSFNPSRLLAGFRETAGLKTNAQRRYDGWENSLIGGHTMGHYLSAAAQAYVNAGVSKEDKDKLYSIITQLIDGLLECQENSKGEPGFVFGAKILDKKNVELQFDNVEKGKCNIIDEAWVPWYTMHKIIAGVLDVYELTGYENALTLAKGLGDWTDNRTAKWDKATQNRVLNIEFGGMNDCMYELYAVTGEEKYAIAAHRFDQTPLYTKALTGGNNALNNLHANTTIPKFLGALNRYVALNGKEIEGKTVSANGYLEYAEKFWTMVVNKHTYITGGNSEWEHFGLDNVLDAERTNCNCETCNVYNMLKLSRGLFEITGEKKYADYYENAYYNAILSSQNPNTGMTMYFQPMATGYFKVYGEQFNKFWCCTGSGMENFSKLNDSIYFYKEGELDTIIVNMYLSSQLKWKDITLTQMTNMPESNFSTFVITTADGKQANVSLRFRIPDWAAGDVQINLNGQPYDAQIVDGYACVVGAFANKDEIEILIPMEVRASILPDNKSAIGFKYGPVVLSADLGTENKQMTTTGMNVTIPKNNILENDTIILPDGVTREQFVEKINDYMKKSDNGLKFNLTGCDYVFGPHYLKCEERYGIYWHFLTPEEKAQQDAANKPIEETTIDTVQPGYGQYENDDLHQMKENNTMSVTNDGTYRYAQAGGSFTYRMAVNPDAVNDLVMFFRPEDNGKSIQVTSGDQILLKTVLDYQGDEELYEVRREIPKDVLSAAKSVHANGEDYQVISITFSGIDGAESAKVCEFIYTKEVTKRASDETAQ